MFSLLLRVGGIYKLYERYLEGQIQKGDPPRHVGIILDGNRRWAKNHDYPSWVGHRFGAEIVEKLLEWCHELKIETVTLYALSTENFNRPSEELKAIMRLLDEKLKKLLKDPRVHRYRMRVKALGDLNLLPEGINATLRELEKATENYDQHFLNIAVAYGGRFEIVNVVKRIAEKVKLEEIRLEDITPATVEENLYTSHLPNPEPDLIIRTSGQERLSGFLLWQSAYSELIFLDVYWPDFRKIDLMRAIRTFQKRSRRFGR